MEPFFRYSTSKNVVTLMLCRFRDRQRFQSKIAYFSHPRVFCAPAEGVSAPGIKKLGVMGLPGRTRNLTISSTVLNRSKIQSTNVTD